MREPGHRLENAPDALVGLLAGNNMGKRMGQGLLTLTRMAVAIENIRQQNRLRSAG